MYISGYCICILLYCGGLLRDVGSHHDVHGWDDAFLEVLLHVIIIARHVIVLRMRPLLISGESIDSFWSVMEFVSNAVVFFLGGVLFGDACYRAQPIEFLW